MNDLPDDTPHANTPHEQHGQSAYESLDDEALARVFLDRDWTWNDLHCAAVIYQRAHDSSSLYNSLHDYDALRQSLLGETDALETDQAEPTGGSGHAWSADDIGAFRHRLAEVVGAASDESASAARNWGGWRYRRAPALAAAVLLGGLLGITVFWLGALNSGPGPTVERAASSTADVEANHDSHDESLTADEAAHYSQAFREVAASLDGRAGWMELSDEVGEVGTVLQPLNAPGRVLVLRLAVWRDGERVARSDVVSRPNQSARLAATLGGRGGESLRVRYALSVGDDAEAPVSIWMGIEGAGRYDRGVSPLLASLAVTQTLPVDAPRSLGTLSTDHGQFRLTASMVPVEKPEAGGSEGAL